MSGTGRVPLLSAAAKPSPAPSCTIDDLSGRQVACQQPGTANQGGGAGYDEVTKALGLGHPITPPYGNPFIRRPDSQKRLSQSEIGSDAVCAIRAPEPGRFSAEPPD